MGDWPPEVYAALKAEVEHQTRRARLKFPWRHADDHRSSGWLGAVKAFNAYLPGASSSSLRTFASHRIEGQIHDDAMSEWRFVGRRCELLDRHEQPGDRASEARVTIGWLLALAQLDHRHLDLIRCRYSDQQSNRQMARSLGVSEGRVSQLVVEVHRKLAALTIRPKPPHNQNQPSVF